MRRLTTVPVDRETHEKLRQISAQCGKPIYVVLKAIIEGVKPEDFAPRYIVKPPMPKALPNSDDIREWLLYLLAPIVTALQQIITTYPDLRAEALSTIEEAEARFWWVFERVFPHEVQPPEEERTEGETAKE